MASSAAPYSTAVGSQQARTASGSATSPREELDDAARRIKAETPWYETLGLGWGAVADGGGDVAVGAVLTFNVVSGLIDAANETVLAPVFVILKGLLGAVQGAAAARAEIMELIQYCVGISRCLLEAAKAKDLPSSITVSLEEFKGEMEAVGRFVQTYGTRTGGCCSKMASNSDDLDTATYHKQKLRGLLDAVLGGFIVQTNQGVNEIKGMIVARDPPRLASLADVPRDAPSLPPTYVERTTLVEKVVADLTDPQRSPTATHCLLGMGGGGKTLLASSVVQDDRVRASFKNGIFWVPVGREGKDVARLLEYLAIELARVPTDASYSCPRRFESVEEVARHLSTLREDNGLRCLLVLDNVWSVEVVDAFASTGFHLVVTTRQSTVISPAHIGLCTEVGDMSEEDALEVLHKASGAQGPLPAKAALEVAHDCGLLPLALGMVGTMANEQPLDPSSWRAVHEKLAEKRTKFEQMEGGKLFSTIHTSLCNLPLTQQEHLRLLAVMASGALATHEMLANLWSQDISDVPTSTRVLVDRCLLQAMAGGYRLHDLVLEYLQLTIKMYGDDLAEKATSRQARYLGTLRVFREYSARGQNAITGGYYSLIALWNSVKKLEETVDPGAYYAKSLEGVVDVDITAEVCGLLCLLGSYSRAESVLREVSLVVEEVEDPDGVAIMLYNLGSAFRGQGKYEEAGALYLKAVGIQEKTLGPDHFGVALSLGSLAQVLHAQGKFDEADTLYLRTIGIQEKALGLDHPHLAVSLASRADTLRAKGKYEQADVLYLRAIGIQENALGANHPGLAVSFNTRANLLQAQGKYVDADALHLRAIKIQEEALGPDHPSLAISLGSRANALRHQGKYEEANTLYLRSIRIKEQSLGADHPSLAISFTSRGNVLQAQGLYEEADASYLRAIKIHEKLDADHPTLAIALSSRANVLKKQGNFEEADALYRRSIGIQEKSLGADHPKVASCLSSRASVLLAQAKYEEAGALFLRAINLQETALGADHPSLALSLDGRAKVLKMQGNHDEAKCLLERALFIRKTKLGEDHEATILALNALKDLDKSQQVPGSE